MRVGIIGRTGPLLRASEKLRLNGHKIAFVMTCKAESYYDMKEYDFEAYAEYLKVPFFITSNANNHIEAIQSLNVDICISINWLNLLKYNFLAIFPFGVLNAHAGDLPKYKGNACPNWAILNFENKIGLTIHKMVEELDSGPYILKRFLDINENTYITDVYSWIELSIPEMFSEAIDLLTYQDFIDQDLKIKSLRTYPRKPQDSRINWAETRRNILAVIRASSHPFDGAFCFLNDTTTSLKIYRASYHDVDFDYFAIPGQVCGSFNKNPLIATRDGMLLIEECSLGSLNSEESKLKITKSLRNRLI